MLDLRGVLKTRGSLALVFSALAGVIAVGSIPAPAFAQLIYVAGQVSTAPGSFQGRLGTLDLATGNVSVIGTTTVGASNILLTGLALASDGTLYGSAVQTNGQGVLYRVNRGTGALTQLGNALTLNGTLSSITFGTDGTLYGLISATNGTASLARFSNLATTPTSAVSALSPSFLSNGGLAGGGGSLFATQGDLSPLQDGGSIYRITPSGNTDTALAGDPGFSGASVFALSFVDGKLYGIDAGAGPGPGPNIPGTIYPIDPTTGTANGSMVSYSTSNSLLGGITAAASGNLAPEPGALALALAGLLPIAGARLARRRRIA